MYTIENIFFQWHILPKNTSKNSFHLYVMSKHLFKPETQKIPKKNQQTTSFFFFFSLFCSLKTFLKNCFPKTQSLPFPSLRTKKLLKKNTHTHSKNRGPSKPRSAAFNFSSSTFILGGNAHLGKQG
jgi:hypothetical protein